MQVGEFEGHITLDLKQAQPLKSTIVRIGADENLHYSEIAGWDEIRHGHHAFLTGHSNSMVDIKARMFRVMEILAKHEIKVVRIKVELCTYDQRF